MLRRDTRRRRAGVGGVRRGNAESKHVLPATNAHTQLGERIRAITRQWRTRLYYGDTTRGW